jgi:formylglycine-generating enzyme required for sulfatase activity
LQNTERFILVVTEGAFLRPEVPGKRDWYYEEIGMAIQLVGLDRITPIIFSGLFNESILPDSLKNKKLCGCQTVKYVPEYAEYFEDKFYKHLGIHKSINIRSLIARETAAPTDEQVNDDRETDTPIVTPKSFTIDNPYPFKMIFVPGGTFQMGSNEYDDEKPIHSVTLSDYYIGETQVTQGLWKAVMGDNPSDFKKGDDYPVECVSWNDIVNKFLPELNRQTGKNFCLPTEAQWEFAARGGNKSKGYKYSGSNNIKDELGKNNPNYGTHAVKSKSPNELGIYDMSGNVWEWCQDWYNENYYKDSPSSDPTGPSSGSSRVLRGGSWGNDAYDCRVSYRDYGSPDDRRNDSGMRLALPCSPFPS